MEGQTIKQKLCWNCEDNVDFGVENCPSCGVYLSTSPLLEEAASSLPHNSYASPPYRLVTNEQENSIPHSPYMTTSSEEEEVVEEVAQVMDDSSSFKISFPDWKPEMLSLGSLLCGSIFSLFGLVLLLFSEDGILTLQWNGNYWYFYSLIGIPLLYFGWKTLNALQEADSQ